MLRPQAGEILVLAGERPRFIPAAANRLGQREPGRVEPACASGRASQVVRGFVGRIDAGLEREVLGRRSRRTTRR